MKSRVAIRAALGAACLFPAFAFAQQAGGSGLTMPYERGFWGHAGLSIGRSELDARCVGGFSCDKKDTAWRIYGGGRFNNYIGGEIGWTDFGEFRRGGGETEAQALDFTLLAGVPFGANQNWAVFGKLGAAYTRSEVSGAGLQAGSEHDWGARYGVGLQAGISRNWAVRADWDRTKVQFRGGDDDVDTLTLGAQYTFR